MARDNFNESVSRLAALRAGYFCSNPSCRKLTTGPNTDPEKHLSIGIAAHISAASPKGPRYDINQTPRERKSIYNAIWICHDCSDIVDKDINLYTKELLHKWKQIHKEFIRGHLGSKSAKEIPQSRGGNAGQIHIMTDSFEGSGMITANGGDGDIGGEGGVVNIQAKKNSFKGTITANGGKSWKN